MSTVLIIILAWFLLSIPIGIVVGKWLKYINGG
jgi:hypothetical protein